MKLEKHFSVYLTVISKNTAVLQFLIKIRMNLVDSEN